MDAPEVTLRPMPAGWVELEHHLMRFHMIGERTVLSMDTEDLRRCHERCHQGGRFKAGMVHSHFIVAE